MKKVIKKITQWYKDHLSFESYYRQNDMLYDISGRQRMLNSISKWNKL